MAKVGGNEIHVESKVRKKQVKLSKTGGKFVKAGGRICQSRGK